MSSPFDLIFGISAIVFNLLIAAVFILSRSEKMQLVQRVGLGLIALGIPFTVVLIHTIAAGNNLYIRVALAVVLAYIVTELLFDFILHFDFRSRFITHFPYIILEYGAFVGLIYTAFTINDFWGWAVSVTFWIAMAALIYYFTGKKKSKKKKK